MSGSVPGIATRGVRWLVAPGICAASLLGADLHAQETPDSSSTAEQRYFNWTSLPFPADEFEARRSRVLQELAGNGGGVLLVASAEGTSGGETFRQVDDFLYLTGLEVPRSVLAIDGSSGESILFAPRRDFRFESRSRPNDFPGRPIADDPEIARRTGLEVRPFDALAEALNGWARANTTARLIAREPMAVPGPFSAPSPQAALHAYLTDGWPDLGIDDASPLIARLRSVKSEREIEVMRRAAELTARSITQAAGSVRPGVDERTLEADFEAACKRGGAQRIPFASIIKSGPNSLWPWRILAAHYDRRNRVMRSGELVIFDVGCELDGYVSDVGRTFPVGGRFSPKQEAALRISTGVSDAILSAVRPGVTLAELQAVAEASIPEEARGFMQTGLFFGHHLGLSTGDPAAVDEPLQPGMIFTVEPWYYDHAGGVSVFIEDEVLVTAEGAEVLTALLPRTPSELAAMVGRHR